MRRKLFMKMKTKFIANQKMDFQIQLIVIKTEYLRKKIILSIPLKKIFKNSGNSHVSYYSFGFSLVRRNIW